MLLWYSYFSVSNTISKSRKYTRLAISNILISSQEIYKKWRLLNLLVPTFPLITNTCTKHRIRTKDYKGQIKLQEPRTIIFIRSWSAPDQWTHPYCVIWRTHKQTWMHCFSIKGCKNIHSNLRFLEKSSRSLLFIYKASVHRCMQKGYDLGVIWTWWC